MTHLPNSDFFNAETHGKRPLNPLKTTPPKRQRLNTDIPESKPSFVGFVVKKRVKENADQSRCSLHN